MLRTFPEDGRLAWEMVLTVLKSFEHDEEFSGGSVGAGRRDAVRERGGHGDLADAYPGGELRSEVRQFLIGVLVDPDRKDVALLVEGVGGSFTVVDPVVGGWSMHENCSCFS
ncbi:MULTISPECIES: hypothetical protein [unclassified Bradyrhizobium]|uniref:hypothetical protein n=1 Tax=unclassified Bradyrhizobium TaxID=2631580 RepID=UPI0029166D6B|nr:MULTISPECIES: hypothetical protein [unclassified Bradyrhizobium]